MCYGAFLLGRLFDFSLSPLRHSQWGLIQFISRVQLVELALQVGVVPLVVCVVRLQADVGALEGVAVVVADVAEAAAG